MNINFACLFCTADNIMILNSYTKAFFDVILDKLEEELNLEIEIELNSGFPKDTLVNAFATGINKITINYSFFKKATMDELIVALAHEAFHLFQNKLILEKVDDISDFLSDEKSRYKSPETDLDSYLSNFIERSAIAYSDYFLYKTREKHILARDLFGTVDMDFVLYMIKTYR